MPQVNKTPTPTPLKTSRGTPQQIVEPNDVEILIKAGFKSANNMLLSFISLVFTVKVLVTEMDARSENRIQFVPA